MSNAVSPVPIGTLLAGKYRVRGVLGQGGMGIVLLAHHELLRQPVALKLLHEGGGKQAVLRFLREARAVALLETDHVARVSDVETLDDGMPFIVMEYLEGNDLAGLLATKGKLEIEETVGYVLQALEAIAEAHANGIVHRDLKPSNLFLTHRKNGEQRIKVLDFGISKFRAASPAADAPITTHGGALGSPAYMSPEQIRDPANVDARTDIWAIGVTLHELVSGKVPFTADHVAKMMVQILEGDPVPLSEARPDAPPALCEAVARCLQRDPAGRFHDVHALARALAPLAPPELRHYVTRIEAALGRTAPIVIVDSNDAPVNDVGLRATELAATSDPVAIPALTPRAASSRRRAVLLGAIAIAIVSVCVVLAFMWPRPRVAASSSSSSAEVPSASVDVPTTTTIAPALPTASAGATAPPLTRPAPEKTHRPVIRRPAPTASAAPPDLTHQRN